MIVIDGFLDSYKELKELSLSCEFADRENPVDGVVYPHIFDDIPEHIKDEIREKIQPRRDFMFMRMSPENAHAPHIAHTDNSMGKYSLMLYLNDGPGGTSLLRHKKTGICYAPEDGEYTAIAQADMNRIDAWAVTEHIPMKQNRAAVFDAHYFHRADPVGGFGSTQADSRIVLTCFYD